MIPDVARPHDSERPPYALRKSISDVKTEVPIERYLVDQGIEVRHGRARCPIHGGDNPQSFSVDSDKQVWYCHSRCLRGGDVLALCQALEGGEVWEAMMTLAIRYDVALPERGNDWRSWQNEKGRRRQALRDVLAESYRRRYFRAYYSGYLQSVDLELREAEARQIWEDLWPMALLCADQRFSA